MSKIPFKVSARTAKLIGQENFSNADGATIELVKNSYDADATQCLVIFDIPYPDAPDTLTPALFKRLSKDPEFQANWYKAKGNEYVLSPKLRTTGLKAVQDFFFGHNSIYIIDNGVGMDEPTIRNQWMEIGTGNKELKYKSDESGRIKTGAKGIGRFALDRLGRLSEMYTAAKNAKEKTALYWRMDWRQFEQPHRSLTEIEAELEPTKQRLVDFLQAEFQEHSRILNLVKPRAFADGTVIKISQLKDVWDEQALAGAFKSLEALVPPKESGIKFELHFFHLQQPKEFGPVETAYFNDYDYKISGDFNAADLKLDLTLDRNELDLKKVKSEYPGIFRDAKKPYDLPTLEKGAFVTHKTANELLKWEPNKDNKALLARVGDFSFTFYFLKRLRSKEEYPFKDFNSRERVAVLEKWGGVKIYRDSFRVRPYGENGNDWLGLGERQAQSTAGAGQRIGQWRVGPNQIAGSIQISRVTNPEIVDKSDRGALVENEIFQLFTKIITGILHHFELDRSIILNPLYKENQWRKDQQRKAEIQKEAERLAREMAAKKAKQTRAKRSGRRAPTAKEIKDEAKALEKAIHQGLQRLAPEHEDNAETAQIRGLASLGIIMASFSHELKELKNNASEIDTLEQRYTTLVPNAIKYQAQSQVSYNDGIKILKTLKDDRQRMIYWIDYALTTIKGDKRKRQTIKFDQYFEKLKIRWAQAMTQRNIVLHAEDKINKSYDFRAFEIDMDTIFSNLITNSIDAFYNLREKRDRRISIVAEAQGNTIHITYTDTGDGLASIFKNNRHEIFLPFVTSKKDEHGNDLGTGLGMYLVKNIVDDYGGELHLPEQSIGFKIKIDLPIRKPKDNGEI